VLKRLRAYGVELVLAATLLLSVIFFAYLGYGLLRPGGVDEPFSGARALADARRIVAFGPRVAGSASSIQTGDWLIEQLRLLGWDVVIQPFSVGDTVQARNIFAVRSHSQPGAPVVLLSAPYDTRLFADADADETNRQQPPPGANQGASGAAVLLELARTLDTKATGHTICLAFFDAESNGGLTGWEPHIGSGLFVENQPASVPRCAAPSAVVNLDLVGARDQRFFQDASGDPGLNAALWRAATNLDLANWFPTDTRPLPPGTTTPFKAAGIPATNVSGADDPFAATMQDSLERLDATTLERVGLTVETWLESGP
jgi:Zn-dependent M28 family amino/carboxypeptidase